MTKLDLLLVDDDPDVRRYVGTALREAGHSVREAADGAAALAQISARVFDVVICDMRLPDRSGIDVFRRARAEHEGAQVILITSFAAVSDAVAALKEGAADYLVKPFDVEELLVRLDGIGRKLQLKRELEQARARLGQEDAATALVGNSPSMVRVRERIATVAASNAPILIIGESGTGKELVARAIHGASPRRDKSLVAVNCAAFPETLLEAELFGHERGAFTGAAKKREGRFKTASGGTLFLDELAEMPLGAQAKLLRTLQEGTIEPLGSDTPVKVDVRLLSATNRDLKKRIAEGAFREDLYYRLNAVSIALPPLRERRADMPLLLHHFLRQHLAPNAPLPEVTVRAWTALTQYPFPGNVRELAHAVQHAVLLSRGGPIDLEHLPEDIVATSRPATGADMAPLHAAMKQFEREQLLRALALAQGKRVRAAELLGISRKNLWEKLRGHGISDSDLED